MTSTELPADSVSLRPLESFDPVVSSLVVLSFEPVDWPGVAPPVVSPLVDSDEEDVFPPDVVSPALVLSSPLLKVSNVFVVTPGSR